MRAAVLLAALAIVPLAADATAPYVADGTLPAPIVPYAVVYDDSYRFPVDAGARIVATLAWADAADDLQLEIATPELRCGNEECVLQIPEYMACDSIDASTLPPGPVTSRRVDIVAEEAGEVNVMVKADHALLGAAYHIEIAVDGAAPAARLALDDAWFAPYRQHLCRV